MVILKVSLKLGSITGMGGGGGGGGLSFKIDKSVHSLHTEDNFSNARTLGAKMKYKLVYPSCNILTAQPYFLNGPGTSS